MRRRTLEVWEGGEVVDNERLTWRLRGGGSRRGCRHGAAWRFESEKRSQLAPLGLKFARSNQYYSSQRYMREDVSKQCTHVHCYMSGGGGWYKEGLPGEMELRGRRWWRRGWRVPRGSQSGATVTRGWREGGKAWMEEGKGWTAGQTKPLLLHFCPSGQTPTLYTRALPSYARRHPCPMRDGPVPLFRQRSETNGSFRAILFEFVN